MRVLIADDEPLSQLILRKQLENWGYDVEAATDGAKAWQRLQQYDAPRLAILDWEMPGLTGPEICRELRAKPTEAYVYVLLLTVRSGKDNIIAGLEAGADDYLTKPFDADQLRARLRAGRRIVDLQAGLLAAREGSEFPATHDATTGLWNREGVLTLLRREFHHSAVGNKPVAVMLAEVDGFAALRGTFGAGADQVLREVARKIRSSVRVYDSVGRYAESQFLIVSPNCPADAVNSLAERIRAALEGETVDCLTGVCNPSLTLGAALVAEEAEADVVLQAVESALEKARRGRRAEPVGRGLAAPVYQ